MLPVMPLPSGIIRVSAFVCSVDRGPLPSGRVLSVEGTVAIVVGTVVLSVVGTVVGMVVGIVVGAVVAAGLEFRQPQPTSKERVRTRTVRNVNVFFI